MEDTGPDIAEVLVSFIFLLGASAAFALAISYLVAAVAPLFEERKPPKR